MLASQGSNSLSSNNIGKGVISPNNLTQSQLVPVVHNPLAASQRVLPPSTTGPDGVPHIGLFPTEHNNRLIEQLHPTMMSQSSTIPQPKTVIKP